jgi:Ca2+-binding RTX toxin-like protein
MKKLLLASLVASLALFAATPVLAEAINTIRCIPNDVCRGTNGPDRMIGQKGGFEDINGMGGNDTIYGNGSNGAFDVLRGGDGNDRIIGGFGQTRIYGDAGNDYIQASERYDRIQGGSGSDTVKAGGANDVLGMRDGQKDRVDCGGGNLDRVLADPQDVLTNCERGG